MAGIDSRDHKKTLAICFGSSGSTGSNRTEENTSTLDAPATWVHDRTGNANGLGRFVALDLSGNGSRQRGSDGIENEPLHCLHSPTRSLGIEPFSNPQRH